MAHRARAIRAREAEDQNVHSGMVEIIRNHKNVHGFGSFITSWTIKLCSVDVSKFQCIILRMSYVFTKIKQCENKNEFVFSDFYPVTTWILFQKLHHVVLPCFQQHLRMDKPNTGVAEVLCDHQVFSSHCRGG